MNATDILNDFRDFKTERDLPNLTMVEYKELAAVEYAENHVSVSKKEFETMVEKDLEKFESDETAALAKFGDETETLVDEEPVTETKEVTVEVLLPKVTEKKVAKKVTARKTKTGSKRDRTVAIYREIVDAGGSRKVGIACLINELGMSKAGASTYWQNVKSGKWV